jgi:hypothetical protein
LDHRRKHWRESRYRVTDNEQAAMGAISVMSSPAIKHYAEQVIIILWLVRFTIKLANKVKTDMLQP